MSIEITMQFLKRIDEDGNLRNRMDEIHEIYHDSWGSEARSAIIALGKEYGFEFSEDDLRETKEILGKLLQDTELSDEQMEKVTGGAFTVGNILTLISDPSTIKGIWINDGY